MTYDLESAEDYSDVVVRDNLNDIFHTNVTAVHNVTQAFLPLLRKGEKKVVINMSVTTRVLLPSSY